MRRRHLSLLAALLAFAPVATAEPRATSMLPLPSELLEHPITLPACPGVTIREWRGSEPTSLEKLRLNALCGLATRRFDAFLATERLRRHHDRPFTWSVSIIPDGACYRCMQDTRARFSARASKTLLDGYTAINERWIFVTSNTRSDRFKTTFTHELFHAMSIHFGLFDAHDSRGILWRLLADERLARGFTEFLGFGR